MEHRVLDGELWFSKNHKRNGNKEVYYSQGLRRYTAHFQGHMGKSRKDAGRGSGRTWVGGMPLLGPMDGVLGGS